LSQTYSSYAELLADPEIDAVYIPLPPSMHCEWTIKAAEAGKHVLCEKPLAVTTAEAIEMAAACERAGVQLMDGVMWVHHDRTEKIRAQIRQGVLGTPRRVTAAFSFCYHEIPTDNIRLSAELAGGCLGDLGYYCVRAIQRAFEGEMPQRVFATARLLRGVDFNLSALFWFANEKMASIDCGFDIAMRQWFEIAGTRHSIVCDDFVLPLSNEKSRFWVHDGEGKNEEHAIGPCIQEVRMIEHFSQAIAQPPKTPLCAVAIDTMRITDALTASFKAEKIVEL
jgi:predicted dehydrogenase